MRALKNRAFCDTLMSTIKAGGIMTIIELNQDDYKGHHIEDVTSIKKYYHVRVTSKNAISFIIRKKSFFRKRPLTFETDLFASYIEHPHAYAIFQKKELVAVIEGEIQAWNNRYRIWTLFVSHKARRRGFGKMLLAHVEKIAKKAKCRAIVLEVRSLNQPAIDFYFGEGYKIIGLDTMAYSNKDLKKHDVRLEMGKIL